MQKYRCANFPGSNLYNIDNYECKLWKYSDGAFDEAGHQIDHIVDHCSTGDNDIDNLQLLCLACHGVKTANSRKNNKKKLKKSFDDYPSNDYILPESDTSNNDISSDDNYLLNDAISHRSVNTDKKKRSSVLYKCKKCGKEFNKKSNYKQHRQRKTKCNTNKKSFKCNDCKKEYGRKDSLARHMKICNNNNHNSNVNKNTKITINKDDTNVNLILLNYPPNKYSFIADVGEILTSDENFIMEIIKKTNINKNRPEHHNIYFPDLKKSTGEIYKNNKWNPIKIDEIINVMIENNIDCLRTYLKDLGVLFDKNLINKIKNTCKEFYDTKSRKILADHIKILLFANRRMIKKTKIKAEKYQDD